MGDSSFDAYMQKSPLHAGVEDYHSFPMPRANPPFQPKQYSNTDYDQPYYNQNVQQNPLAQISSNYMGINNPPTVGMPMGYMQQGYIFIFTL